MRVNGEQRPDPKGATVDIWLCANGYDVSKVAVAVNGEVVPKKDLEERVLKDEDDMEVVSFVGGGRTGYYEDRTARCPAGVVDAIRDARIGIAGCGGLGSNVAVMLARSGAMHLVIADFDRVEESNLNRQMYFRRDLGRLKAEALADVLHDIDPDIEVEVHAVRLTPENIPEIYGKCDVLVEAFDIPSQKKMIIETACSAMPEVPLVCGNGMAGVSQANRITTRSVFGRVTMCGDGESESVSEGIMAPRVTVCAGHMANAVIRILMGNEP